MNKASRLLTLFFVSISLYGNSQILSYVAANFAVNSGFEFGSVELKTNEIASTGLFENEYEYISVGASTFKLGVGFQYIFGPRLSYGWELNGGLGVKSKNTYDYYLGVGPNGASTYEVSEKLDFVGLSYNMEVAFLGDLEDDFAVMAAGELGIQGSRFVSVFDDYEGTLGNDLYSSTITGHSNAIDNEISHSMFSAFLKLGVATQYMVTDNLYFYGGLKYAFVFSYSDNDHVKRNNWLDLDLGIRIIMY